MKSILILKIALVQDISKHKIFIKLSKWASRKDSDVAKGDVVLMFWKYGIRPSIMVDGHQNGTAAIATKKTSI